MLDLNLKPTTIAELAALMAAATDSSYDTSIAYTNVRQAHQRWSKAVGKSSPELVAIYREQRDAAKANHEATVARGEEIRAALKAALKTVKHEQHGQFVPVAGERRTYVAPNGDRVQVEFISGGKRITGSSSTTAVRFTSGGETISMDVPKHDDFTRAVFGFVASY